jgi:hypothetical protein
MYSILFCRRYPALISAQALQSAVKYPGRRWKAGGVQAGNFKDEPGEGYDVALLFNIFMGLPAQARICWAGRAALNPAGDCR